MAAALTPWPLTVQQYHAMIDKGILTPEDPVELLEGVIVQKVPKNPPHSAATRATRRALERVITPGWFVDSQEPITLDNSEPEPDVTIIRGDSGDYANRHPGPGDIALVVEISDATLDRDRLVKNRIYASAQIPSYWIVDLTKRHVLTYSDPDGEDYAHSAEHLPQESVALMIDGRHAGLISVRDLLP